VAVVEGKDAALRALAEALLEHEDDALVVLRVVRDGTGRVVDFVHEVVNAAAERNAGRRLLGRRQLEVYPVASESMFGDYCRLVETGEVLHTEVQVEASSSDTATAGKAYLIYARPVAGEWVVCQYRDVTELRATQRALQEQALHDPLTGLPNRRLLLDHLELALARLPRHQSLVALMVCDLDQFKEVNDTHGHPAGDEVLQQVAQRLQSAVRPQDTVARVGGDEFVVLSEDLTDDSNALVLADRVRTAVKGAYSLTSGSASIDISIGIATAERPVPIDRLLSEADAALYKAKGRGDEAPIALA
jgi:diguanylate cyclase (GGDEF)-like protein